MPDASFCWCTRHSLAWNCSLLFFSPSLTRFAYRAGQVFIPFLFLLSLFLLQHMKTKRPISLQMHTSTLHFPVRSIIAFFPTSLYIPSVSANFTSLSCGDGRKFEIAIPIYYLFIIHFDIRVSVNLLS